MITKEQALTATRFKEVAPASVNPPLNTHTKQRCWRANGKCKVWKRDKNRFQLPIKHGLYSYGYLTNDNAHLFMLDGS